MESPSPPSHDPLARSLSREQLPSAQLSLALLARAQQGDGGALVELLVRYEDRLRRIVRIQLNRSPLRRHYDSMDLVQRTYAAALPKVGDLRPRSAANLLQWLAIIATHQIRDALDREFAQRRDLGRSEPMDSEVDFAAPQPSPDEQVELAEVRELLDAAVACLPADQQRVVLLRDYCGESWGRIAAELDREAGAARQLHQRAWIQLRRTLRPALEGLPGSMPRAEPLPPPDEGLRQRS